MKANFAIKKNNEEKKDIVKEQSSLEQTKKLTQKEFEEFIIKSGAKGSFMVYRSEKKEDELGLEQL